MRELITIITVVLALFACDGKFVQVKTPTPWIPDPTCTIYQDFNISDESLIKQQIANPCAAQDLIVTVTSVGIVWDAYTVSQFNEWVDTKVAPLIQAGASIETIKMLVVAQINKLNDKVGKTMVILSQAFLSFPNSGILHPDDVKLMLASLEDVKAKVKVYEILSGRGEAAIKVS